MREFVSFSLNGRATNVRALVKNKTAHVLSSSNHWSVTENNTNNSWNINFNNGNLNNNNKNNSNVGRAGSALGEEEIISWIKASDDCCRNKKTSYQCTMYRIQEEELLLILALSVHERVYTPLISECFVVKFPKLREIFAANFLDRIIQHWIILRIEPLLEDLFVRTGDVSLWDKLPPHKSLFTMDGMAIGNITSQILANFYLNKFDKWAYEFCKERNGWYQRFVDDMTVILPTTKDVTTFYKSSTSFLKNELLLTLHPDKVYIQYAKKGVKFIGSVVMPNRIYLSNRTVGRMYEMLKEMEDFCSKLNPKNISINESYSLEHYVCSCNSYMGFLKYNNSYALRRRLFGSLSWFWKFAYASGHFDKIVLRKRFNTSEVIMKLNGYKTIKKKIYGNKVFSRNPRKGNKKGNKKNIQLQHP